MDTQFIENALRLAGAMLTGLVVANFVAAKRWDYSGSLAGTAVIVRQVFHVHCAYIVAIIAALAVLASVGRGCCWRTGWVASSPPSSRYSGSAA